MLVLLSVLLLSSHVQSQTCDEKTEYLQKDQCCKKCEPGQFMEKRCGSLTDTQCGVCSEGYYMDVHNVNYKRCNHCTFCTKEHMKYKQICTSTSDAVCTCDDGYRCSDLECKMCVKVQTNTPTPRPATTKTALTSKNMTCKNNCMPTSDGMYTCDDGYRCSDSKCKMCVEVETNTPSPPFTTTKTSLHPHDMHDNVDGSCQHQSVSGTPKRATMDPVSAQRKRRYNCQCRRCVGRQRHRRMSEKERRRPLVRLRIEYLL